MVSLGISMLHRTWSQHTCSGGVAMRMQKTSDWAIHGVRGCRRKACRLITQPCWIPKEGLPASQSRAWAFQPRVSALISGTVRTLRLPNGLSTTSDNNISSV